MPRSAVTISLVPEAKGGPFILWDDLAGSCAKAASLGFDAVEIFPPSAEALDARTLQQLLDTHQLQLAAIGTGAGWLVQQLHLTDPDPNLRQRAVAFIGALVDFAGGFRAPAIVGSMQGRFGGDVTRDQALAWLREALEQLGSQAEAYGVPLLLEPLNRYETNLLNTVAQSRELLQSLRTKNIRLLCDLFHMNIEEESIAEALRDAGFHLGHVHFADNNRRPAGLGHIDYTPIAQALRDIGYSGYLSTEAFPFPDSEAAARQTIACYKQFFTTNVTAIAPFQSGTSAKAGGMKC